MVFVRKSIFIYMLELIVAKEGEVLKCIYVQCREKLCDIGELDKAPKIALKIKRKLRSLKSFMQEETTI